MHPCVHAGTTPEKLALILADTGQSLSYGELEARSNQAAQLFRALGFQPGDAVAVLLENHFRFLEIAWGAQRAGLYFVAVSSRLTANEAAFILRDSGARALISSAALAPVASTVAAEVALDDVALFMLDGAIPPFRSWEAEVGAMPVTRIADERAGTDMLYSSGTTGRPKGIRPQLPETDITMPNAMVGIARHAAVDADTIYLSPAPLYHAAPLRWCMAVHRLGGTVVVMEKFDPEQALALIERHKVTHAQWVPTHFIRMLKLPDEARRRHDLTSLRMAIHAAAPCPVPVKQAMIDWWGPVLLEYYAGTEGNGLTMIGARDWLTHPGSVGRAVLGTLRICDEQGEPLPAGETGLVHFEGGPGFHYHNDSEKTAAAANKHGWTTLGDVGHVDAEGYLYLTDRKSFMIISGGVNIYPQEIENLLVLHPKVADVAVIGAPHADMGEQVVAVVQPAEGVVPSPALAEELAEWLAPQLSRVKQPRRIDFVEELPRHPTGKLYKRLLRDRYWEAAEEAALG